MNWKPVELIADYWIIVDEDSQDEYQDYTGHNLMFSTEHEAKKRIELIKEEYESGR